MDMNIIVDMICGINHTGENIDFLFYSVAC